MERAMGSLREQAEAKRNRGGEGAGERTEGEGSEDEEGDAGAEPALVPSSMASKAREGPGGKKASSKGKRKATAKDLSSSEDSEDAEEASDSRIAGKTRKRAGASAKRRRKAG
jgi:hypothetical protein